MQTLYLHYSAFDPDTSPGMWLPHEATVTVREQNLKPRVPFYSCASQGAGTPDVSCLQAVNMPQGVSDEGQQFGV